MNGRRQAAICGAIVFFAATAGVAADSAPTARGYLGVIVAQQSADIAAETPGTVVRALVGLGDAVRAGQSLVQLSVPGLDADLARAEASHRAAQAQVERSRLERDDLARQCERRERAPDIFTPEEVEALRTRERVAASDLEVAASRAAEQEAAVDGLRARQRALEVRAPFAGTIGALHVEPGEYAAPGATLMRLVGTAAVTIRFAVPAAEAAWVAVGKPVTVRPDGRDEPSSRAIVRRVAPEIDAATGMIFAEATFETPAARPVRDPSLAPGAVVRVHSVAP